jgi:uncharacterized protein YndB with AHSA1/START domain
MPVKKDPSGRRSVQAEVEVPGTPEQVWQAIATGPGISSWFVPAEIEEREGGTATTHFGPGNTMDSVAKITEWDPPRRFVAETEEGPGKVATEWTVQTRSGDSCVVRVVHSWFATTDDWDHEFEGHTYGWLSFFRLLRLYLTHFPGARGASFQVMGTTPPPKEAAWKSLMGGLGIPAAKVGAKVATQGDAPQLAGTVEWAGQPEWPEELVLRLDTPAVGIAHFAPHPMSGKVFLALRFYLFGEAAAAATARMEPEWAQWIATHFAPVGVKELCPPATG